MDFSKWSPMTVLTLAVISILLIVGGLVTVLNPDALSFNDYFNDVTKVMAALGLAVPLGRGIHFGLRDQNPKPIETMTPTPVMQFSSVSSSDSMSAITLPDESGDLDEVEDNDLPEPPKGHHV